jgi:hypothetical protein
MSNKSALIVTRADIWWYCTGPLLETLPVKWCETCTLIQLAIPFTLTFWKPKPSHTMSTWMPLRSCGESLMNSKQKKKNQIAAGFESALFWWPTISKNVDWTNYIYYNQRRLVNYPKDAVKGIAEQQGLVSKITWENWMAPDMILAENGGRGNVSWLGANVAHRSPATQLWMGP